MFMHLTDTILEVVTNPGFSTIIGGLIGAFSGAWFADRNANTRAMTAYRASTQKVFTLLNKQYEEVLSIEKCIAHQERLATKMNQIEVPENEYRVSKQDLFDLNLLADKEIVLIIWELIRFPRRFDDLLHSLRSYNEQIACLCSIHGERLTEQSLREIKEQQLTLFEGLKKDIKRAKESIPYNDLLLYFRIKFPALAKDLPIPEDIQLNC